VVAFVKQTAWMILGVPYLGEKSEVGGNQNVKKVSSQEEMDLWAELRGQADNLR
jgi:hypothetical protein